MKAVVYTEFGGPEVLQIKEVLKPSPKPHEILIRVQAVSINYGDLVARNFKNLPAKDFNMPWLFWMIAKLSFGLRKPLRPILGNSFSGYIETIGETVTYFKPGDRVFGFTGEKMGALAEYLTMPEDGIIAINPDQLSWEEAAAVPYGAVTALSLLKKVKLSKGSKVLVMGAGGAIGSAAVQLASQHYNAEVTGICGQASLDYVQRIGAVKVLDYRTQDFTQSRDKYDLIFDVLGKGKFSTIQDSLNDNGIYFSVSFKLQKLVQMLWTTITGGKKVQCALANATQADLIFIKELIEAGRYKSMVEKTFPLEQAIAAHRYAEKGNGAGLVVITFNK